MFGSRNADGAMLDIGWVTISGMYSGESKSGGAIASRGKVTLRIHKSQFVGNTAWVIMHFCVRPFKPDLLEYNYS